MLAGQGSELEPAGAVLLGAVLGAHPPHRRGLHLGHLEHQGKQLVVVVVAVVVVVVIVVVW